ncbi:MAG: multiheme c-type cytochrome [Thermodesulfobacteriota bacterium]
MGRYGSTIILLLLIAGPAWPAADDTFLLNDQCVQCHLTGEQTGKPNSVLAWKQSAHFRPDAGCTGCHGSDRFVRQDFRKGHIGLPDRSRITEMCGACHQEQQKQFLEKMSTAGPAVCAVTCTDCHGYHLVRPSDSSLINSVTCGRCHPADRGEVLAAELARLETRLRTLTSTMENHKEGRIPVDTIRRRLAGVKTEVSRTLHSRKFDEVLKYLRTQASGDLDAIENRLSDFSPRTWRLEGVVVTMALVLAFVLVLAYLAGLKRKEQ